MWGSTLNSTNVRISYVFFKKIYVCNPQHFLIKTLFFIFSTSNSFCFWKAKLTVFTKKSQHIHPEPEKKDCLFHRKCVRKCQTSLIHSEEIFFFFKENPERTTHSNTKNNYPDNLIRWKPSWVAMISKTQNLIRHIIY